MSQLQLIYLVVLCFRACNCQQADPEGMIGFVSAPDHPYGRGTLDILWGCLFTLFVCFWSIQHPNLAKFSEHCVSDSKFKHKLPEHMISKLIAKWLGAMGRKKLRDSHRCQMYARAFAFRVTTIYLSICGPEFLLSWAYTEWLFAGQVRDEANKRWLDLWHRKEVTPATGVAPVWTRTHGFCAIMRGFAVQHGSGRKAVERPWTQSDFNGDDDDLLESMQAISKEDLEDKSKTNWAVRIISAVQITWFVVQQGFRFHQGLPRAQLEVATIAYFLCTLPAYFFYWR